ncbi:MAG: PhzF family phenazine biosynthesis protein, partial [Burkholderiaceae bacterium]
VLALHQDWAALHDIKLGVVGGHAPGGDVQFEVRALIGEGAGYEDPVTGSLNASLAQWLIGAGTAGERYVAAQGACLQRAGRVFVERDGAGQVWVGGNAVTCVRGSVSI